ncbi:hypothetical protein U9M48_039357 [Paspalum notatum var. saurae]|uniref:Aminotransferase-like plant mobile domain-containing protein n=1 Tax=Paspalum notatum var. saurae TaxID=547442 RepID=A0AAQ3XCL9_PASNO
MSKTFATSHEFIFNHKFIHFTKDMVIKVLGFPSSSQPVQTCSDDFEIEALVEKYKLEYVDQNSYTIRKCMDLMSKENDETTFMRHFLMFLISTILIPGKANTLTVEYLCSLVDVEKFASYDWAEEVLHVIMFEVNRFHTLRDSLGHAVALKHFYMEGCLPLLPIVYADFLDLPQASPYVHRLNYGVPRICNLSTHDFEFVMAIDRNNIAIGHFYGMYRFRNISLTPYQMNTSVNDAIPPTYFDPEVSYLVEKHRLLLKHDLLFLTKTWTDVLENRIQCFASDFNYLFKSKIEQAVSGRAYGSTVIFNPSSNLLGASVPCSSNKGQTSPAALDGSSSHDYGVPNDNHVFSSPVDDEVVSFYQQIVLKNGVKNLPSFIAIGDINLTYKEFQQFFKKYINVTEKVMEIYVIVFNGKPENYMFDNSNRKKISFAPTFTKKLLVNPTFFSTSSCTDELKKSHELLDINNAELATNFSATCTDANIFPTSSTLIQSYSPCNYPYEHTVLLFKSIGRLLLTRSTTHQ